MKNSIEMTRQFDSWHPETSSPISTKPDREIENDRNPHNENLYSQFITPSRPAGLAAARQAVADEVRDRVIDRLSQEPCVSYILGIGDAVDWGPEVDIAVRMLQIDRYGCPLDEGRLNWRCPRARVTPQDSEAAQRAVAACADWLQQSGQPFEFLTHIEGQSSLTRHPSPFALAADRVMLSDAIADEVRCLTR